MRRRRTVLAFAVIAALAVIIAAIQSPTKNRYSPKNDLKNPQSVVAKTPLSDPSTTTTIASTPTTIDPGLLPQTNVQPASSSVALQNSMRNLFYGITQDSIATALKSFFTLDSYLSVKSLQDDAYDYAARLVFEFSLDVEAAHNYIASQGKATFVGIYVPSANVHYVSPGVCYNRLGYWMVPDSRLLYSVNGKTYSIGIASLISWRGTWYVVHLGAISRPSRVGVVDSPATGVGPPGPSGGC